MRRILPRAEYRLIKNRKYARVVRQKRRVKNMTDQERLAHLEEENKKLRAQVANLESKKHGMSSHASMDNQTSTFPNGSVFSDTMSLPSNCSLKTWCAGKNAQA